MADFDYDLSDDGDGDVAAIIDTMRDAEQSAPTEHAAQEESSDHGADDTEDMVFGIEDLESDDDPDLVAEGDQATASDDVTPEDEQTEEPEGEIETPSLDPDLIIRATQAGLPAEQIKTLDPTALAAAVTVAEGVVAQQQQNNKQQAAPDVPADDEPAELEKLEIELDEEVFDEDAVKTINALNDHYHNQLNDLYKQLQQATKQNSQLQQTFENQMASQFYGEMDSLFANDPQLNDVFGQGATRQMKPGEQLQARQTILNEIERQNTARPDATLPELFRIAKQIHFADQLTNKATETKQKKKQAAKKRHTAKPTHKGNVSPDEMPKGVERAKARLRSILGRG